MGITARVIPTGNWASAKTARVEIFDMSFDKVDVVQIPWTDAKVTANNVTRKNGAVYLNEQERPKDKEPIELECLITHKEEIRDIVIKRDEPWASGNGKVALFLDEQTFKMLNYK